MNYYKKLLLSVLLLGFGFIFLYFYNGLVLVEGYGGGHGGGGHGSHSHGGIGSYERGSIVVNPLYYDDNDTYYVWKRVPIFSY